MIRTNFTKVILMGVWSMALAISLPSCTDDHFDIPEDTETTGGGTQNLWALLESNEELSNFTQIVEKTPFFKDEKHKVEGYTFKDVLSGNQVLTVFAPDNDAFTETDVQEYEELLQTSPYDAFLRLVGNHIVKNRYVASGMNPQGKAERVIFINNKKGYFDREAKTIKDVALEVSNIAATNGVLHVIGEQIPFAYNIYEYIRANKDYSHLNEWISQHDTLYFNSTSSAVAGTNPETGEPIYVDSVYTRFNSLYWYSYQPNSVEWVMPHKGLNANIEQEDSTWAMVLPTDAAWEEATEALKPYYNYVEYYYDMTLVDALLKDDPDAQKNMTLLVKDTVQEAAINMDLVSPLVFNVRMQRRTPEQTDFWTVETFLQYKMSKLFNTRADTFMIDDAGTPDPRDILFEGKDPIHVSNGLIYPVDHWNFRNMNKAYNVEVKAYPYSIFQNVRYNLTESEQKSGNYTYMADYGSMSFNNGGIFAPKYGWVSKSSYMTFYRNSGEPKVCFKLRDNSEDRQILSNIPYEVGVVLVPDFYRTNQDPEEYPEAVKKNRLNVTIKYLSDSKTEKTTKLKKADDTGRSRTYLEYDGLTVDTIWMDETITFPCSYRNLTKAYPIITIGTERITQKMENEGYQPRFNLDRIILRPKQSNE